MTSFIRWASGLLILVGVAGCEVDYDTEPDPAPDREVYVEERELDVPDVEIRETPDVRVQEPPDVNVQEGPDVNVEEAPDLELNESPDVEIQESPGIEQTPGAGQEAPEEPQT